MKVQAFAKINLALNVGEVQNGFHLLQSVAVSVDIFDVVEVSLRADSTVTVAGCNNVLPQQNTAYRAATAFVEAFGTCGCDVVLHKGIPFGAGLGGSSADAAAVLYCLCALHGVDMGSPQIRAICAQVGSDVTFMLAGGIATMCGKGDDVAPLPFSDIYFALTTFSQQTSTQQVYSRFDVTGGEACHVEKMVQRLRFGDVSNAILLCGNGLQRAVESLSDYAQSYLQFCMENNLHCTMTGSGSAYFVPSANKQAAEQICRLLNDNGFSTTLCRSVAQGVVCVEEQ